jgi:hypothetical protein
MLGSSIVVEWAKGKSDRRDGDRRGGGGYGDRRGGGGFRGGDRRGGYGDRDRRGGGFRGGDRNGGVRSLECKELECFFLLKIFNLIQLQKNRF